MFQFFIHLIWPKRASRKKKLDKESSVRKLKYNTHCPLNAFDIVLQFPLFTNIDLYWSICLIRNYCLLLTNESIIYMNVLSLLYFVVCLKMTRNVLSICNCNCCTTWNIDLLSTTPSIKKLVIMATWRIDWQKFKIILLADQNFVCICVIL